MAKIQSIEDTECWGHRLPRTQLIQDTKYPRQKPLSKGSHKKPTQQHFTKVYPAKTNTTTFHKSISGKNQHNNLFAKTNTTTFHKSISGKNQHNNISQKYIRQKPTQQPLTKVSPTTTHQRHPPKDQLILSINIEFHLNIFLFFSIQRLPHRVSKILGFPVFYNCIRIQQTICVV